MKKIAFAIPLRLLLTQISVGQNTWVAEKIMEYKNITNTNISQDGNRV